MNSIPVNHWEDLQKGAYKFPAENRSFLQNLFVTAANAENEKQIKIHIPESGVYRDVIARYKLRGIRLKTVKRDNWNYQYTAVVRPGVLLSSMRRFRKAGRPEAGQDYSIKDRRVPYEVYPDVLASFYHNFCRRDRIVPFEGTSADRRAAGICGGPPVSSQHEQEN